MPHSSGGGSHSGGSHSGGGGGHSSSHSSGGGGGGGGLPSNRRTSSVPFRGCRTFLYYRNNQPVFVYSNYDIRKRDPMPLVSGLIVFFLFLLPVLLGCLAGMYFSFEKPKRLKRFSKCPELVIEDNLGIFEDETRLEKSMESFFDTTGIVPAVVTVSNDEWQKDYDSLERYAYDLYLDKFKDEYHWLIVYSEAIKDNGFNDWYWEGMQGDNTDPILTKKRADEFTLSLHDRLLLRDKYSVDTAIAMTLDEYEPKMMEPILNTGLFIICLFAFLLFLGVTIYSFAVAYRVPKVSETDKNALPVNLTAIYQEPCAYCGGVYVLGMHTVCPHCGAALPEKHYTKDAQGNVVEIKV